MTDDKDEKARWIEGDECPNIPDTEKDFIGERKYGFDPAMRPMVFRRRLPKDLDWVREVCEDAPGEYITYLNRNKSELFEGATGLVRGE